MGYHGNLTTNYYMLTPFYQKFDDDDIRSSCVVNKKETNKT